MFQRQSRQPFPARNIIFLAAAVLLMLFFLLQQVKKQQAAENKSNPDLQIISE